MTVETAHGIVPLAALGAAEREALRALNNLHAEETSFLTPEDWEAMTEAAALALAAPGGAGFLLAFDETGDYGSPNFLWFRNRFPRFLYVDRVVVAEAARGRGLARAFYDAVLATARAQGRERVVCEVNRVPPNPGSDAFHDRMGFAEVGVAEARGKTVRYLERRV